MLYIVVVAVFIINYYYYHRMLHQGAVYLRILLDVYAVSDCELRLITDDV